MAASNKPKVAAAPATAASTATEEKAPTVYITKTGAKYHLAARRYLSKSIIPISLKDAKARGYEPCSVCKPPE